MKRAVAVLLAAAVFGGCMRYAPEVRTRPPKTAIPASARESRRLPPPLVIEVALVPEPGSPPCPEAPAAPTDYLEEVRDCVRIGAAAVRVQPLASDSGAGRPRYDRSLANYRRIVAGVLLAAPDVVIDLDLEGAPPDAAGWARCNGRIEILDEGGARARLLPAGGEAPLEKMRKIIAGGGHLRIGLRESRGWPYRRRPGNLDYLRRAVSMARAMGRPVATPAEAREMLGLKPLTRLYAVPGARTVKAGERFSLDVIAQPLREAVKGYVVFVAPDGKRYSLAKGGRVARGVAPFISDPKGIRIPFCRTVFDASIHPATRQGDYTVVAALVPPDSAARLSTALAVAIEKVTVE